MREEHAALSLEIAHLKVALQTVNDDLIKAGLRARDHQPGLQAQLDTARETITELETELDAAHREYQPLYAFFQQHGVPALGPDQRPLTIAERLDTLSTILHEFQLAWDWLTQEGIPTRTDDRRTLTDRMAEWHQRVTHQRPEATRETAWNWAMEHCPSYTVPFIEQALTRAGIGRWVLVSVVGEAGVRAALQTPPPAKRIG